MSRMNGPRSRGIDLATAETADWPHLAEATRAMTNAEDNLLAAVRHAGEIGASIATISRVTGLSVNTVRRWQQ